MNESRYRPVNLGQTIDSQGRYRKWIAVNAGISPALLSMAIDGKRTLSEPVARRIAELIQVPFFLIFELVPPQENEDVAHH